MTSCCSCSILFVAEFKNYQDTNVEFAMIIFQKIIWVCQHERRTNEISKKRDMEEETLM